MDAVGMYMYLTTRVQVGYTKGLFRCVVGVQNVHTPNRKRVVLY